MPSSATEEIIDAFRRAELPTTVVNGEKTHDTLLSSRLRELAERQAGSYVFITVPEADRIADIAPILASDDAMLVMLTSVGKISRRRAASLATEFTPAKIILAIC